MTASMQISGETGFAKQRIMIRSGDIICELARRLWPSKTADHLASRAGVTRRAAQLWLEGRTEPGTDALLELLRSDAGFPLLQQIMSASSARWWPDVEQASRIVKLERDIAARRAQLNRLIEVSA